MKTKAADTASVDKMKGSQSHKHDASLEKLLISTDAGGKIGPPQPTVTKRDHPCKRDKSKSRHQPFKHPLARRSLWHTRVNNATHLFDPRARRPDVTCRKMPYVSVLRFLSIPASNATCKRCQFVRIVSYSRYISSLYTSVTHDALN